MSQIVYTPGNYRIMKTIMWICLMVNISGCDYLDEKKMNKEIIQMCSKTVVDDAYPLNVKPGVVVNKEGDFNIALHNTKKLINVVVGPYQFKPRFDIFSVNDDVIEWCPYALFDLSESSIIIGDEGFHTVPIGLNALNKGIREKSIKDGIYKTRFRVAEAATQWCSLTIKNRNVSSLECPKDKK